MWQNGSPGYSDGSSNYSGERKSGGLTQESSCDGTEISQLYCDSNAIPQAELPPTESPHATPSATTSSHLIISRICFQNWLGNSTEPLSGWDILIIRLILLRTALRFSGLGMMAAIVLLVSGMWICRDFAKTSRSENSRQSVLSEAWPCVVFK
ncbi:MAG: hypothetical protein KME52_18475 [Desmonostoc geniculatum HA4340-LM1]|nr:hypothetical protein [Desmonostoc geniculatum HA4340-LM1]